MARPKKIVHGTPKNRTVVLRASQDRLLQDLADGLGLDVSDVLRAMLDFHFPLADLDRSARLHAALELHRRQLAEQPLLLRTVVEGWAGREMTVPIGAMLRPAEVRLVGRTVEIARRLYPAAPTDEPKPEPKPERARDRRERHPANAQLPDSWATTAPDALLTVVASPAVQVVDADSVGRPTLFVAVRLLTPVLTAKSRATERTTLPETQYEAPAECLARLINAHHVEELREESPAWLRTGGWRPYRIQWSQIDKDAKTSRAAD